MPDQKKEELTKQITQINRLKVGHLQLQTKSFWITIVAFITIFVFGIISATFYFAKYCIQKNCQISKYVIQKNK